LVTNEDVTHFLKSSIIYKVHGLEAIHDVNTYLYPIVSG
jgi:hypothetical protein